MSIKNNREYRMIQLPEMQFRAMQEESEEPNYRVEGYATTYDEPYTLFHYDGIDYKEQISRDALAGADMSDVIFLYNHEGMVFARQSNGTLVLESNEHGLHVVADLSSTEASRQMYESIKAGLVTQMSWAFTIADGGDSYDEKTHTRSINSVSKIFDVSCVSIPANPSTDIAARSYFDGVIEAEKAERLEREAKKAELRELLKGVKSDEH